MPKVSPSSHLLDLLRKRGSKTAGLLPTAKLAVHEVIPTGLNALDQWVLGCGGLPVGFISEWYSAFGGGKSAIGLTAAGNAQRRGGVAVYVNGEHAPIEERAPALGCDPSELIVTWPLSLEAALGDIQASVEGLDAKLGPNLIVWDSVGALGPKGSRSKKGQKEIGSPAETGLFAAIMTEAFKRLVPLLKSKRVHLLCVNQVRVKLGVMFGDNTTTPGGNAFHHYASHRLQFLGGKATKDKNGDHLAKDVTVLATKTRFSPPFRKARARLNYGLGWDDVWSTLEFAKGRKLITPRDVGFEAYLEALKALGWPAPPAKAKDRLVRVYEATRDGAAAPAEAAGWDPDADEEDEDADVEA